MTTTAERLARHVQVTLRDVAQFNSDILTGLLAEHGFDRQHAAATIVDHAMSGISVACGTTGFRISFQHPDGRVASVSGIAAVDLPIDTAPTVVAHVALALHQQVTNG